MQQPGDKPGTAVALRGIYGCGKTIIVEYLRRILRPHLKTVSDAKRVTGKFNSLVEGLVLLGLEEGFWAGSKADESVLKDLITAATVTVEAKFMNPYETHAHARVFTTSNAAWVVPAGPGDRRWAVFDVLPNQANKGSYWTPIWDALYADGPAHLLHHLLNRQYDKVLLRRPPMTQAKVEQTIHSLDPVDHWWFDVLCGERLPVDPVFGEEVPKDRLYTDFTAWCQQPKRRETAKKFFWKRLHELTDLKEIRKRNGSGRIRHVQIPSLAHCQQTFARAMGCDWSELDAEA